MCEPNCCLSYKAESHVCIINRSCQLSIDVPLPSLAYAPVYTWQLDDDVFLGLGTLAKACRRGARQPHTCAAMLGSP
jgi:hypothetical protein